MERFSVALLALIAIVTVLAAGWLGSRPAEPAALAARPVATRTPTVTPTVGWWAARDFEATPALPGLPALPTVEISAEMGGGAGKPVAYQVVSCPRPDAAQIVAVVRAGRGWFNIYGNVGVEDLWYWKAEISADGKNWTRLYADGRPRQGLLVEWRTDTVPAGTYLLRLMAVDRTGNYPEPCIIQISTP